MTTDIFDSPSDVSVRLISNGKTAPDQDGKTLTFSVKVGEADTAEIGADFAGSVEAQVGDAVEPLEAAVRQLFEVRDGTVRDAAEYWDSLRFVATDGQVSAHPS